MNALIETHIKAALEIQARTLAYEAGDVEFQDVKKLEVLMSSFWCRVSMLSDMFTLAELREAEAAAGIEDRFCAFA